jgi:hypothetical protein
MTFDEVPMGHIFQFDCDCFFRRDGHWSYVAIERCERHKQHRLTASVAGLQESVQYDALAAMMEALSYAEPY